MKGEGGERGRRFDEFGCGHSCKLGQIISVVFQGLSGRSQIAPIWMQI